MQIYIDFRGGVVSPTYAKLPTETMSFLDDAQNFISTPSESLFRRIGTKILAKGDMVFKIHNWENKGVVGIYTHASGNIDIYDGNTFVKTLSGFSFSPDKQPISIPTIEVVGDGSAGNPIRLTAATILYVQDETPYIIWADTSGEYFGGGAWDPKVNTSAPWNTGDYTIDNVYKVVENPESAHNGGALVKTINFLDSRIFVVLSNIPAGFYIGTALQPLDQTEIPVYEDFFTTLLENIEGIDYPNYGLSVAPYFYQTERSNQLSWIVKSNGYFYGSDKGVFYAQQSLNYNSATQAEARISSIGAAPNLVTVLNKGVYYVSKNRKMLVMLKESEAVDRFDAIDAAPQMRGFFASGIKNIASFSYPSDVVIVQTEESLIYLRVTENGLAGFPLKFESEILNMAVEQFTSSARIWLTMKSGTEKIVSYLDILDYEQRVSASQEYKTVLSAADFLDSNVRSTVIGKRQEDGTDVYYTEWDAGTTYSSGDIVWHNNRGYVCATDSSTGDEPDLLTAWLIDQPTKLIIDTPKGVDYYTDEGHSEKLYSVLYSDESDYTSYSRIQEIEDGHVSIIAGPSETIIPDSGLRPVLKYIALGYLSEAYIVTAAIPSRAGQRYNIKGVIVSYADTDSMYIETEDAQEKIYLGDEEGLRKTSQYDVSAPTEFGYDAKIKIGNDSTGALNLYRIVIKE